MNTNFSVSLKRGFRNSILGLTVIVACISTGSAQTIPPLLPDGDGAWILQVATRGGLDGQGKGDLWITSKRELSCSRKEMACAKEITIKTGDDLTQKIAAMTPAIWSSPASDNLCPECLAITMRLTIRGHDGAIQTFEANWDIATQGRVPAELLQFYNAAAAVAK